MARDIKFLVDDLEKSFLQGKGAAASPIAFSLANRSPIWTGTFNRSWKIQKNTPVAPTKPRDETGAKALVRTAFSRIQKREPVIMTTLSEILYIGNETKYAGFVINEEPSPYDGRMYKQSFDEGYNTTPIPNLPDWYDVYLLGDYLFQDLEKGFQSAGFTSGATFTYDRMLPGLDSYDNRVFGL